MESILESLLFVVGDEGITFEQIKQILDIDDNKANEVINNLKIDIKQKNSELI